MGTGRLYAVAATWLRVTAVGWLLTVSATITLNIFRQGLTPVGTYLLPLMLMGLTLLISGQTLSCDGKPYAGAFAAALLSVALTAAVRAPLAGFAARTVVYLLVSVVVMLLFVHGGIEVRQWPVWGIVQILAPLTAVSWGVASGFGSELVLRIVGDTLPWLLLISALAAAAFAVVFEVMTATALPARS